MKQDSSSSKNLNEAFASHMLRYVGIGLISGSVVHAGTLGGSWGKYLVLIVLGIALFVGGVWMDHRQDEMKGLRRYILISVALSIGTGMVSGATQHYLDGPKMASVLLPLGLLVAYLAMGVRDFRGKFSAQAMAVALLICLFLGGGLSLLATRLPQIAGLMQDGKGGHGH